MCSNPLPADGTFCPECGTHVHVASPPGREDGPAALETVKAVHSVRVEASATSVEPVERAG